MTLLNWHIAFTFYAIGMILLADKQAFAWVTGAQETLAFSRLRFYHYATWAGLLLLIASGVWLLSSRLYLLAEPLFIIKLLFVGILVVNAVLIERLMPIATKRSYRSLTFSEKMPLLVSGGVSALSWASAILIAWYLFG